MTTQYVTYFDSNYLTRGLALYRSLQKYAGDFRLWIVCFDDLTYELLTKLALPHVVLVSMKQFENDDLLRVRPTRTRQEYCWTCTPAVLRYVLETAPEIEKITYLDADTMLFASPEPVFAEVGDAPIVITEHRWTRGFDLTHVSGIYSVQFMIFRRTAEGMRALNWWYDRCIEWCYARYEDGKFGDQKYLDDWPERFSGVHVVRHPGLGVAPWNNLRFRIAELDGVTCVDGQPLILYHAHSMKQYPCNVSYLYGWYPISAQVRELIYRPYLRGLAAALGELRSVDPAFSQGISPLPALPGNPRELFRFACASVKDVYQGRYFRVPG